MEMCLQRFVKRNSIVCQGKHKLKVSWVYILGFITHPLQKSIICYLKDMWTLKQGIVRMYCLNGTFICYVTLKLLEGVGCKLLLPNLKRWKGKMCYLLSVDCVFSPAQQREQNIPFPKRDTWFMLGDIIQAHKFPVEQQKAWLQQGVKIQGAW